MPTDDFATVREALTHLRAQLDPSIELVVVGPAAYAINRIEAEQSRLADELAQARAVTSADPAIWDQLLALEIENHRLAAALDEQEGSLVEVCNEVSAESLRSTPASTEKCPTCGSDQREGHSPSSSLIVRVRCPLCRPEIIKALADLGVGTIKGEAE